MASALKPRQTLGKYSPNVISLAAADNFSGLAQTNPWALRTRSGKCMSKTQSINQNCPAYGDFRVVFLIFQDDFKRAEQEHELGGVVFESDLARIFL